MDLFQIIMRFTEYMKGLSNFKTEQIKAIAGITCSTPASVYRWMNGCKVPSAKRKVISDYLGKSEAELWPELADGKGKGGEE